MPRQSSYTGRYKMIPERIMQLRREMGWTQAELCDAVSENRPDDGNGTTKLQNAVAILESQYTKQISELKDEWHNTEKQLLERNGSLIKEGVEKDKQLFEQQKEIEIVSNMNFWQFRKWKKEQRKKSDIL